MYENPILKIYCFSLNPCKGTIKYVNEVYKILTNVPLGGSDLLVMIFDETAVVPKVSFGHRKIFSYGIVDTDDVFLK